MRRLIGRALSAKLQGDEIIVRLAKIGNKESGSIVIIRIDAEKIKDAQALPIVFPLGALTIFNGYYEGFNGFSAKSFEVIQPQAVA
jgi:hypothetical protein